MFFMSKISINKSNNYLEKDGKPFFLLSDTDWMAFQKLNINDWRELVRLRKEQGFTALQISVMPISHDNSKSENDVEPFALVDGKYDFSQINEEYFNKADEMLRIMDEYGMVPFLHLFWANYIPDTWAAKSSPDTVIPFERLKPLAEYIINRFKGFNPIYSVSGDTNFETDRVVQYYLTILDVINELDPSGVTTLHLQPTADPPEILRKHPQYNFYSYQSGHGRDQTSMIKFSNQFLEKPEIKPIVNTEPCYEGHGYGGEYGRFTATDIRNATWCSLLSGAKAGITYGAHGVWQFYDIATPFNNVKFSSLPYGWRTACRFPGAWDVGYAKWLFEKYGMFTLSPAQELIEKSSETIRVSSDENKIVIYLPFNHDITVLKDLSDYNIEMFTLDSKRIINPWVDVKENKTLIHMCECNEDTLIVAVKK